MIDEILTAAKKDFEKSFEFLKKEFSALQTGRASASLVENVEIESYGQKMPLKNLANISIPSATEIFIDPWDKSQLSTIEKAIRENQHLGFNPINSGAAIRINVPPLTEERRREMVKIVHQKGENAKVSVRKARHDALAAIKKSELSDDEKKAAEKDLQKAVDAANAKIDELIKHKESEILTI